MRNTQASKEGSHHWLVLVSGWLADHQIGSGVWRSDSPGLCELPRDCTTNQFRSDKHRTMQHTDQTGKRCKMWRSGNLQAKQKGSDQGRRQLRLSRAWSISDLSREATAAAARFMANGTGEAAGEGSGRVLVWEADGSREWNVLE